MQLLQSRSSRSALALLVFLAACQADLAVPREARITCASGDECPAGRICRAGLCVLPEAVDTTPPDLAEPATVSPAAGKVGTRFTIGLSVTETLSEPPQVSLGLDAPVVVPCQPESDLQYLCAYQSTGEENGRLGGVAGFDVKLVDRANNVNVKRFAGALRFDFAPPSLAASSVAPDPAGMGSVLQIFFTASEPLADGSSVVLKTSLPLDEGADGMRSSFLLQPEGTTLNYRFTHPVTSGDPVGTVEFTVSLEDRAGNLAPDLLVGSAKLDSVVPALLDDSVSASRVRAGTGLVVAFKLTKAVLAAPVVKVGELAMDRDPERFHPDYRYTRLVSAGDGEGTRAVLVSAKDEAGNPLFVSLGSVTFDFTAPALLSAQASPAVAKVGDEVFYTITPSEGLALTPALRTSGAGAVAFVYQPGTTYAFKHTVGAGDPQGAFEAVIDLVDEVGNAATDLAGGGFRFDSTIPRISAVRTDRARYSASAGFDRVTLGFDCSEPVDTAPAALTVTLDGDAMSCGAWQAASPSYTCTRTVRLADGAGTKNIAIAARDGSGNTGFGNGAVVLDFTAPGLLTTSVTPPLAKRGDAIFYTIAPTEPLLGTPVLTIGGAGSLPFLYQAGTSSIFRYAVVGTENEGAYTVAIDLTDEAGNTAQDLPGAGFSIDVSSPAVSAVAADKSRYSARTGFNAVTVTFDVSESLDLASAARSVTIGGAQMSCGAWQAVSPSYTCTRAVAGTEGDGPKNIAVSAHDAAGNVGFGSAAVEFDFTPPSLLSTSVAPAAGKVGDEIFYTVTPDERLSGVPTLATTATLAFAYQAGTAYVFKHAVTAGDANGAYTARIAMIDQVGNAATDLAGQGFTVDSTVPVLSAVATNRARYSARSGFSALTLTFNASENVPTLSANVGGAAMSCGSYQASAPNYTCTFTVTTARPEGTSNISISARDPAGNIGFASTVVDFDFTPPALVSTDVSPPLSRIGDNLTYTVTPSENLAGAPALSVSGPGPLSLGHQSGTKYIYRHAVTGAESGGRYAATMDLTDEVGNTATGLAGAGFDLDVTVPSITSVATNRARYSARTGFKTVTLTFDVSESVDFAGARLSAKLGGAPMTCGTFQAAAPRYTCTYTVLGSESPGTQAIAISATDAAGNIGFASASVDLDFTAPSLLSTTVSPALARIGDTVSYTISAAEPLAQTPALAIAGAAAPVFAYQSGTQYIFHHLVTASDLSGAYTATVDLVDSAGNTASALGATGFAFDVSVPVLSGVATNRARYSAQAGFNVVSLTFNASESLDSTPASLSVTLGGAPMTCGSYQASPPSYTCTKAVLAGAGGTRDIAISARDAAGNVGFAGAAVVFDFTPPALISTSVTPALAKTGDSITYTVTPDERLAATPTLTIGGAASPSFAFQAGTEYIFKLTLSAASVAGDYTAAITMTDEAGNVASALAGTGFSIDVSIPSITGITTNRARYSAQTAYRSVVLTFNTSESLSVAGAALSATVGTLGMLCGSYQAAAPNYTCTYTVTGSEGAGTKSVTISARDAAGNQGFGSTSVVFDFAGPTLVSTNVTPAFAGLGDVISYTITPSELLSASPTLTTAFYPVTFTHQNGTSYIYKHTVTDADTTYYNYSVAIAMTDEVGNAASGLAGTGFAIDSTVPVISAVTTNRTAYSWQTGYNNIVLTFNSSEPVDTGLTVTVGTRVMTCGNFSPTPPRYTCTYTITGGTSGLNAIAIAARDPGGNTGVGASSVMIDFSPPGVFSTTVTPARAKVGDQVVYTITPTEPLLSAPAVTIRRTGGYELPFAFQTGTAYIYRYTVTGAEPSGTYTPSIDLVDESGNPRSNVTGTTFDLDTTVPTVSAVSVSSNTPGAPGRIDETGTVTVTFNVSEPISAPVVTVVGRPMSCGAYQAAAPNFTCTYVMQGNEIPAGTEATQAILIEAADDAGNRSTASGSIVFDFKPPGIASAGVSYRPGANNPLTAPANATVGTTIRVTLVADEPLDTGATLALLAQNGATTLTFTRVSAIGAQADFEATLTTTPMPAEGGYTPYLTATDLAGNGTTLATFTTPVITVDRTAPALTIAQSQVSFLRSPWGNSTEENPFPAGPYFALSPPDSLSDVFILPANTFTLTEGGAPALVRVWSDGTADAHLLGTVAAYPGGSWPRQRLANVDTPAAWVSGLDPAGNESPKVKLTSAEWVATLNPPAFGANQNGIAATSYADASLRQDPLLNIPAAPEALSVLSAPDSRAILARAEETWRRRAAGGDLPSSRYWSAMAFDSARGRMVVFGGGDSGGQLGDTWEFDGESWTNKTPLGTSPARRYGAAMVYDSARGRMVLFGGDTGGWANDLWEWDGTSWTQRFPIGSRPLGRHRHGMAYDSARKRIVVFGGNLYGGTGGEIQDTWEWDGDAWTDLTPAGTKPPARESPGMVYDSVRGRVVMFGGSLGNWYSVTGTERQDVWEWNGTTWVDRTPAGTKPSARTHLGMTYDPVRQRTVVFGGAFRNGAGAQITNQEIWEWNGAPATGTWTNRTPAGTKPDARRDHSMAFDLRRSRTMVFGGSTGLPSPAGETWEWDGVRQAWSQRRPGFGPRARMDMAMVYDSSRGRVVLYGGEDGDSAYGDTWEWDGSRWAQITPATATTPGPRTKHAMAYDPVRMRTVLFGGRHVNFLVESKQDCFEWDGATWTGPVTPTPRPGARIGHGMAYDSARSRVVLFGGFFTSTNTFYQDLWEWNGSAWLDRTPVGNKPAGRYGAAMSAFGSKVLVFGGLANPGGVSDELWEWDGSTAGWTRRIPSGAWPMQRYYSRMAYDSTRGRAMLFGGWGVQGGLADVWEWDGTGWTEQTQSRITPSARAYHGVAYDAARSSTLVFGGYSGTHYGDTWTWDAASERRPALTVTAQTSGDFPPSAVTGLRVRLHAGGKFAPFGAPDVGAALFGWSTGGPGLLPGSWIPLAANDAGVINLGDPIYLEAPPAAFMEWTASSAAEAQRYVSERDRQLSFQVQPGGSSGTGATEASVALDYLEVRVRYLAP